VATELVASQVVFSTTDFSYFMVILQVDVISGYFPLIMPLGMDTRYD
jgi:hypothetical protein